MRGKIYIEGVIGSFVDDQGIEHKGVELVDIITQVRKQPEATSFYVFINSPGGVVQTGEDIYSYLRSVGVPITTVGVKEVCSIATFIFMAGDYRIVDEKQGCQFMIHLPTVGVGYSTADEISEVAKSMKAMENDAVNFYVTHTGLTKEAVLPLLRNETWLTPEQLEDFGFLKKRETASVVALAKTNIKMSDNSLLSKLKSLVMSATPVSLILKDASDNDVDFYELSEDEAVIVGAKARINGANAEGQVTMADGRVVTFEAGVVTEIMEASEETEMSEDEELALLIEEMVKINEATVALKKENETLKEQNAVLSKKLEAVNLLESKIEGDQKKEKKVEVKKEKVSRFSAAMKKVKSKNN